MVTSICILDDQIRYWWLLLIMASHGSDVCKSRRLLYLVYAVQVLQFLFRVHIYILIIHQVEHGANFRQEKKGEANSYSQAEHDRNSLCTTQTPPQQCIFQSLHKAKQKKRKECFLLLSRFCFFFLIVFLWLSFCFSEVPGLLFGYNVVQNSDVSLQCRRICTGHKCK